MITLTVSDASALFQHALWNYANGGTLTSVNGEITFSGYKPNAPVSPSVFAN